MNLGAPLTTIVPPTPQQRAAAWAARRERWLEDQARHLFGESAPGRPLPPCSGRRTQPCGAHGAGNAPTLTTASSPRNSGGKGPPLPLATGRDSPEPRSAPDALQPNTEFHRSAAP